MTKILYLHQYFKTPKDPGGTRSYWISQEFIERGHQVTVISARSEQVDRIEEEIIDDIKVIYVKVGYDNKMNILKRLFSFLLFVLYSTYIAFKQKDVDLIYATSTPLTIGIPALVLNKMKRMPYIFEVRDLWPEVPIQMGAINNKILINISRSFEKLIYKNAIHIVALSPGMKKGVIDTHIQDTKVSMFPNMSKIDIFYPRSRNHNLEKQYGIESDKFKLIYFGALGLANAIPFLLEVILKSKSYNNFQWIIIGKGVQYELIETFKKDNNLENLILLRAKPMDELAELVNLSDASLVTFSDYPILNTNSPNKLFDSLSAGKPIVVNSSGWTKKMVEENHCGIYVKNDDVEDFIQKITEISLDKPKLMRMGENSLNMAKKVYDKSIISKDLVDKVEEVFNAFQLERDV